MNARVGVMDDMTSDQNEENFPEIHDDMLEAAAGAWNAKADPFTQSICTALYFCPGP
jgi:hypothetical protein